MKTIQYWLCVVSLLCISFPIDFRGETKDYFSNTTTTNHFTIYFPHKEKVIIPAISIAAEKAYLQNVQFFQDRIISPVSYTHLTLPTIYSV